MAGSPHLMTVIASAAVLSATALGVPAFADVTGIAQPMPVKSDDPLITKTNDEGSKISQFFTDNKAAIADPVKRKALLETEKPAITEFIADNQKLIAAKAATEPGLESLVEGEISEARRQLALLGDPDANKQLQTVADGPDAGAAFMAKTQLLQNRWSCAGDNPQAQTAVADDLEKLAGDHKDSIFLTRAMMKLSQTAATPELKHRLEGLSADVMQNDYARMLKQKKAG